MLFYHTLILNINIVLFYPLNIVAFICLFYLLNTNIKKCLLFGLLNFDKFNKLNVNFMNFLLHYFIVTLLNFLLQT